MRRSAIAAAAVIIASSTAAADPEPSMPPPETEAYRGMMMLGDAAAMLFTVGGSTLTYRSRNCECEDFSGELVLFGLMTYVAWGAVVHHEAGHGDRAVVSVLARTALPITAGVIAHEAGAGMYPSFLAAGGGMAAAMAFDWFVLADARRPATPRVTVYAIPTAGGAIAGLAGPL